MYVYWNQLRSRTPESLLKQTSKGMSESLRMVQGWRPQYGFMCNPWTHSQMCEDMQDMPTQISLLSHASGSEAMIPQGHSQCLYVEFQYYFLANVTRFPGGCSTFYSRWGNTRWFRVMLMPRSKEVLNTEPKPNPKMRV